jgi:nitroreductase
LRSASGSAFLRLRAAEDRTLSPAGKAVDDAITSRRSIRAFLPIPVERAMVEHLLAVASRAPSGTNMQPWQVYALAGASKDRLADAVVAAHAAGEAEHNPEYTYYPDPFFEPYLGRRRKVGWDLYGLLGIERGEKERTHQQHARNFRFFDAAVGMIFTIDRRLRIGSWLDYGMFLENIMVAARGHGLDTCVQAAFASYPGPIRRHLALGEDQVIICGMSLGYADPDAVENTLATDRAPPHSFCRFMGFDDAAGAGPADPLR